MENLTDMEKIIANSKKSTTHAIWRGTFLEYLTIVEKSPSITMLAHQRIYQLIIEDDVLNSSESEDVRMRLLFQKNPVALYSFFREFYGIEHVIEKIVQYFYAASLQGEESRQLLYLMGPVGSGKSSIVEALQCGLENAGVVYGIDHCPLFEEPLHLVPKHARKDFERLLNISIEGDLCRDCQETLENTFEGNYERMPVVTRLISKKHGHGIGVIFQAPSNLDRTFFSTVSDDASQHTSNRSLYAGSRGMVECHDLSGRIPISLHTAIQEKIVPEPKGFGSVYLDTAFIAHSNEPAWKKLKADPANIGFMDRIVLVNVPYNVRLSEEIKIYEKILGKSTFKTHKAPHTLEISAMFAVLTRLEPMPDCDPITKMYIYNGEEDIVRKNMNRDIETLRKAVTTEEGMYGISTRFIMKMIDYALTVNIKCINPVFLYDVMERMIKEEDFPSEMKKMYLGYLDTVRDEYCRILLRELTIAGVHKYEDRLRKLFRLYLDHMEADVNNTNVKDESNKENPPDRKFLKSIENNISITTDSDSSIFRRDVISHFYKMTRNGEAITYMSFAPLKEAIEMSLINSMQNKVGSIITASTRDNEQKEKYETMVENFLSNGYCNHCVDVVFKYAANNLWKDLAEIKI